jgi:2-C-methyl-D-erythritol 2,4-cyclodiphosphate synthase
MTIRVGQGFDVHGFTEERPLVLGGVRVQDSPGLEGHSDADVLSHAIADALLGAAGLGDLGMRFPADERWKDAAGLDILQEAAGIARDAGWRCINVDSTIVAEQPRLSPHVPAMRSGIAAALSLAVEAVSVKATTTDGLGFAGRGDGMAVLAVVLVER